MLTQDEAATIADAEMVELEQDRRDEAAQERGERQREDGPQLRLRMEDA